MSPNGGAHCDCLLHSAMMMYKICSQLQSLHLGKFRGCSLSNPSGPHTASKQRRGKSDKGLQPMERGLSMPGGGGCTILGYSEISRKDREHWGTILPRVTPQHPQCMAVANCYNQKGHRDSHQRLLTAVQCLIFLVETRPRKTEWVTCNLNEL